MQVVAGCGDGYGRVFEWCCGGGFVRGAGYDALEAEFIECFAGGFEQG